jgi:hypothetical protein
MEVSPVKKRTISLVIVFASVLATSFALGLRPVADDRTNGTGKEAAASPVLNFVPASDALVLVDVERLLNEVLPRVFAGDPAKLAQANADLDRFKARTGIDPHSFDRVAVGMSYTYPAPNVTKVESVTIVHCSVSAVDVLAAARATAKAKYQEQNYRGAPLYIFTINEQLKLLGLGSVNVRELAVSPVDANTLAVGEPAQVRLAIDANKGGKRISNDLITLATRDPNAIVGFGANVSSALLDNLQVGNDELARDISGIRQIYGSLGTSASDLSMLLVARTVNAQQAKNLGDTVEGLKQLGAALIARMPPEKRKLAQSALDNMKIKNDGNELQISTQVAEADIAPLMHAF